VVGGLLLSQALTLFTTPVIYLYLDRVDPWRSRLRTDAAPAEGAVQDAKGRVLRITRPEGSSGAIIALNYMAKFKNQGYSPSGAQFLLSQAQ
jgi:hypothetical protein